MNAKVLAIVAALALVAALQYASAAPHLQESEGSDIVPTSTPSATESKINPDIVKVWRSNMYDENNSLRESISSLRVAVTSDGNQTVRTVDIVYANGTSTHEEYVDYDNAQRDTDVKQISEIVYRREGARSF